MAFRKKKEALAYHARFPSGKLAIRPTKGVSTQADLSLAYSPGVAEPCLAIADRPESIYNYTSKGNLVAVITNGSAVLGLGDIGAAASKPVMEGKAVLFKKFADIDVFDLELDVRDADQFIDIVCALEPTFGGINLEDIKAPESFYIERVLCERLKIPVMHDDQHGTAIISAAALLNALELTGRAITDLRLVVNGAGAAALACVAMYELLGLPRAHIVMVDSKGVIHKHRSDLSELKARYATEAPIKTLSEALKGADMFLGLSRGNVLNAAMLQSMAARPIVFALANPDPEIAYETAKAAREDLIMATGRSDHPNQVNNVLGFPYIFRGALDVRASCINDAMKLAAVHALAALAKAPVPEKVMKAYGDQSLAFGKDYLIPKPMDERLITELSAAVAQAAIKSKVARHQMTDWDGYRKHLLERVGQYTGIMPALVGRARQHPKRIVFSDGDQARVLRTAYRLLEEGLASPIVLGNKRRIEGLLQELQISTTGFEIIDPFYEEERRARYADLLHKKRCRKGLTAPSAQHQVFARNTFGILMVETQEADAFVGGLSQDYVDSLRMALTLVGTEKPYPLVASMYVVSGKKGTYFMSDPSVNIEPTDDDLVHITALSARLVAYLDHTPRIALLSYSNFGSSTGDTPHKMQRALKKIKAQYPDLVVEGEMQADTALSAEALGYYPFNALGEGGANTLIFPNLTAGNIAYKMVAELGQFDAIGPILMGMQKPIQLLQHTSSENDIFNLSVLAVLDAQAYAERITSSTHK